MINQSCSDDVALVGRFIRVLHEIGLHAQAVKQWPIGETRSAEWAHVVARYFEGRRLLEMCLSAVLDPIGAEIDAVSFLELFEMEATLQDRLPRALDVIEAAQRVRSGGPRGGVRGADHSLVEDVPQVVEAITTLASLISHIMTHFQTNPFPTNPNIGRGAQGVGGVALIDERDDAVVIAHIRAGLESGAFSEALDPTRSTVPGRDIPLEDRGRTSQYVGGPGDPSIVGADPQGAYEPAGTGPGRSSPMQLLEVGMWAAQEIPKLVALIKQMRTR